jgi:hypothetical protein
MSIVGEIQKNKSQKIIVATNEYKGKQLVDIRVHYEGDDGEYMPTKKGIALTPEMIPEVMEMLRSASAVINLMDTQSIDLEEEEVI